MTATLRRLLLLLVALPAVSSSAFAHRLDEYLQATLVSIEPGEIRLKINLMPGVAVAGQVLAAIDRDRDGVISASEGAAYAASLKDDLTLRMDGRPVELKLAASDFPDPAELRAGVGIIQVEFTAMPAPLVAGAHRLTLENRHLPPLSVYLFNAAQPKSASLQVTAQRRNQNQSTGEIEFTLSPPAHASRAAGLVDALAALLPKIVILMEPPATEGPLASSPSSSPLPHSDK